MEKSIDQALLKVQKEIVGIVKENKNPYYKSAYFDINKVLSVVRPVLNKHGLLISQPTKYDTKANKTLVYTIIVGHDDYRDCNLPLPEITDPQKLGSCITYYRRYTLVCLLALESLDDDANLASGKVIEVKQIKKPKAKASEVSALIKNGNTDKARDYFAERDWVGLDNLKNKLTNHFKNQ